MKETALNTIKYFGIYEQKRKFGEECDELKEAITEYEYATNNYEPGEYDEEKLRLHIAEEITDVYNMILQFGSYYQISEDLIKEILKYKQDRTNKKIEEEKSAVIIQNNLEK